MGNEHTAQTTRTHERLDLLLLQIDHLALHPSGAERDRAVLVTLVELLRLLVMYPEHRALVEEGLDELTRTHTRSLHRSDASSDLAQLLGDALADCPDDHTPPLFTVLRCFPHAARRLAGELEDRMRDASETLRGEVVTTLSLAGICDEVLQREAFRQLSAAGPGAAAAADALERMSPLPDPLRHDLRQLARARALSIDLLVGPLSANNDLEDTTSASREALMERRIQELQEAQERGEEHTFAGYISSIRRLSSTLPVARRAHAEERTAALLDALLGDERLRRDARVSIERARMSWLVNTAR